MVAESAGRLVRYQLTFSVTVQTALPFVNSHVVYYWINRKVVKARRLNQGMPYWITIDSLKEKELVEWVSNSSKIKTKYPVS
jgi:hypothetical protein